MKTWTLLAAVSLLFTTVGTSMAENARSGNNDRADIEKVQKALKQQGHDPGAIDGVLGPQTSAALRAYQKEQGLSATGRLDDATLAKLQPATAASGAPPQPASRESQPTGGDRRPSAVDPAEAKKTGANVGEGASYSRSTEKGQSTLSGADQKKK